MEDKNNNLNENKQIKEENNIPFLDYIKADMDLLPILNESISNQKKFISFIKSELKKLIQKNAKKDNIIAEKIFSFLIENYKALGLPFFSLLIKENEFSKDIVIGFFYDNKLKNEIISLVQKMIDIFNFDFAEIENNNPIEEYFTELNNYGIIDEKEIKKNEKRLSLTDEELLFVQLESYLYGLKESKEIGNNIEKDTSEIYKSEIESCEENLKSLQLTNASLEFYQEKIVEIKNFSNKNLENNKDEENENQNLEIINNENANNDNTKIKNRNKDFKDINDINNDIKLNFIYEDDDEPEINKINSPEKIIKDIKELRKKPLKDRVYFYKDEQILEEENQYNEFKRYSFPLDNPKKYELARQFCSFMNYKGGRLYIGITDANRIIKGVVINRNLSYYENIIFELVKNFYPKINAKEFLRFYAIPIKNNHNGKIIPNLFVFKIIIKKGDPSKLYSMTDNGLTSSIRLYGQCANLTAEEIHKEIIDRDKYEKIQNIKLIEDEDEMNDPYPDENSIIINNYQNKKFNKKYKNNKIKGVFNNDEKYEINNNYINKNNHFNKNNDYHKKDINYNNKNDNTNNNINENLDRKKIMMENNNELFENEKEQKDKKSKEKEENFNFYMNNKTKKKKNKKKYKNDIFRVEISNIDKNVDEAILNECFRAFNCQNLTIYKQQNGVSNGFMDFVNKENALDCIKMYNNSSIESKNIQLKLVEFYE